MKQTPAGKRGSGRGPDPKFRVRRAGQGCVLFCNLIFMAICWWAASPGSGLFQHPFMLHGQFLTNTFFRLPCQAGVLKPGPTPVIVGGLFSLFGGVKAPPGSLPRTPLRCTPDSQRASFPSRADPDLQQLGEPWPNRTHGI